MAKKPSIQDRIRAAFEANGNRSMTYQALAHAVFPPEEHPNAWRYRAGGGPPGCYMTLSATLRRMNLDVWYRGDERLVRPPRV